MTEISAWNFTRHRLPRLVLDGPGTASVSYIEFFIAHIRNANTRAAYHVAVRQFFRWCEDNRLTLMAIRPVHVATYIEYLAAKRQTQTVKLHLAAIRALFDWFVVHQVVPFNPCSPVKGPRYSIRVGKTPVLSPEDTRKLLAAIGTETPIDLRDRALIAFMVFTFTRIGATVGINIGDLYVQQGKPWVHLFEKGGRDHTVALHPDLEAMVGAYMAVLTDLGAETPLFRAACGRSGLLTNKRLDRRDAWAMVQRRATLAGLASHATCHSFRATGITSFLQAGGTLDDAADLAAHSSTGTTRLYDRRKDSWYPSFIDMRLERTSCGVSTGCSDPC